MKLHTLRELARKTIDNPKGQGIIDIHYNNLARKVEQGKLIPTETDIKPKGYSYHRFNQVAINNYKRNYK